MLTRKDNLQITLAEDLAQVPINLQNSVVKHWLEDNNKNMKTNYYRYQNLHFTRNATIWQWRKQSRGISYSHRNRWKNAQYLKTLMNFGYENKFIQHVIFVHTGIHLTTSLATYKGLLRKQNEIVKSLLVLPIEGMSENAIMQDITIEGMVTTVGEYIMAYNGIKGLKRTRKMEEI
eukprot:9032422-Ditylum_brightwellii.AAC.1